MKEILTILTSEDKDEIRKSIKEIIIKQVITDFDSYGYYLFDPIQVSEMMSDVVEEVKYEIKDMYKEKLLKQMEEKLNL